jgi:hypothetical protein
MAKLLTRDQTAKKLGTSKSNVRRLEKDGVLKNSPDARGHARYSRYAVDQLARARGVKQPRRTQGQVEAEVFRLLREGKSPGDVVEATQITMVKFRELYAVHKGGIRAIEESLAAEADEDERAARELDEQQTKEMDEAFSERRAKFDVDENVRPQMTEPHELAEIERALRERYPDLWSAGSETTIEPEKERKE